MSTRAPAGVLVATHEDGSLARAGAVAALDAVGVADGAVVDFDGVTVATWGLPAVTTESALVLSRTNWHRDGCVEPALLHRRILGGSLEHLEMLPPFAGLAVAPGRVRLVTDLMGLRQLYWVSVGQFHMASTSARALSAVSRAGLDHEALALQTQLGWQVDQATLFSGVRKLSPGESLTLTPGVMSRELHSPPEIDRVGLDEAVQRSVRFLRTFMAAYLEDRADPVLQLTGGQDSRILLSAIPASRRRGLRVMTVKAAGSRDAEVASEIADRYAMNHRVQSLDGLAGLSPLDCFELVREASARLECMADPLARAATLWAERQLDQGDRLSGLGGEIARGFYYTGRVREAPITDRRIRRLVNWRMFANEPVESVALADWFGQDAKRLALEVVERAIRSSGTSWYPAMDELYYQHRMQRWAGVGETAVCLDRALANPMLDPRFLAIARGLSPRDKQHSTFLAKLQVELDDELAALPLDNRPPPRAYARSSVSNAATIRAASFGAATRKVRQRLRHAGRPPAGAGVIARKFAEHVRSNPEVLDPVRSSGVFAESWLEGFSTGAVDAAPGSLALLANIMVAFDR